MHVKLVSCSGDLPLRLGSNRPLVMDVVRFLQWSIEIAPQSSRAYRTGQKRALQLAIVEECVCVCVCGHWASHAELSHSEHKTCLNFPTV